MGGRSKGESKEQSPSCERRAEVLGPLRRRVALLHSAAGRCVQQPPLRSISTTPAPQAVHKRKSGCEAKKFHRAADLEEWVWGKLCSILTNPEKLRAGLEEMIERERKAHDKEIP